MKHRGIWKKTMLMFGSTLLLAGTMMAETIGPNCGSCYGATYTLDNLGLQGSTATTETWRIGYTINTTGYTGSATNYIRSVAVKVTNNVLGASLVSASSGGVWTLFSNSTLSNNDCGSTGGAGFVCAQDGTSAVADGSSYTWVFDITMNSGSLLTAAGASSIKANYDPPNGLLVSEAITLGGGGDVPEPASLALLGGGLLVWGWSRRRKARA